MSIPLQLPKSLGPIPQLAQSHRFAARNTAIAELALYHGWGVGEMAALNCSDLDPYGLVLRRSEDDVVVQLRTRYPEHWRSLVDGQAAQEALLRSRSHRRLTRVDIWRVLHRLGLESQLSKPLHTRAARNWLGTALAISHGLPPDVVAAELGVSDLRAVAKFYSSKSRPKIGAP